MYNPNWEQNIYNENFTKEDWDEWETEEGNAEDIRAELEKCNNEFEEELDWWQDPKAIMYK